MTMNDARQLALRLWIEREFAHEGVLAVGGGLGASGFPVYATAELLAAQNDEVWRQVAAMIAGLRAKGAPVSELLWGFEHAILCTMHRDDGLWLGVFTAPRLSDEAAVALRAKLDAFKEQTF